MPRRRSEYDDYEEDDEFDLGRRRRSGPREIPTSAGMIGFISAMVGLAFLVVVAILYFAMKQEDVHGEVQERTRLMYYWFLILDIFSFFAAIVAVVFASRGLSPANPLYRGWAITALILGIIEIIATLLIGLFMTCAVLIFEAMRNAG
jgi:vacuolar-type H+-ATPase subunit I/STV1